MRRTRQRGDLWRHSCKRQNYPKEASGVAAHLRRNNELQTFFVSKLPGKECDSGEEVRLPSEGDLAAEPVVGHGGAQRTVQGLLLLLLQRWPVCEGGVDRLTSGTSGSWVFKNYNVNFHLADFKHKLCFDMSNNRLGQETRFC